MSSARQALCVLGQSVFQAVQVHQGGHECSGIDIGVPDQLGEESHQRRQASNLSISARDGGNLGILLAG